MYIPVVVLILPEHPPVFCANARAEYFIKHGVYRCEIFSLLGKWLWAINRKHWLSNDLESIQAIEQFYYDLFSPDLMDFFLLFPLFWDFESMKKNQLQKMIDNSSLTHVVFFIHKVYNSILNRISINIDNKEIRTACTSTRKKYLSVNQNKLITARASCIGRKKKCHGITGKFISGNQYLHNPTGESIIPTKLSNKVPRTSMAADYYRFIALHNSASEHTRN